MHETLLSDSEDEGGDELLDHNQYKYMATDDLKANYGHDHDHQNFDTTNPGNDQMDVSVVQKEMIMHKEQGLNASTIGRQCDNALIVRPPVHLGFLVSFLVDARGGSMRGYRHSGVRIIVPPKACSEPTRITCRYVKPQRVANPPPLMEGEALVSRILEMSPVEGKFLSPITLEVPHFGSLRENEREIIILRSDNGESWREHSLYENEEHILDALNDGIDADVNPLEELHTSRIVRIVTQNVPHFFAVVSRVRQEVHAIGPDGGTVSSIAVPQVQAIFPPHALTKKIRVGLQAQPVDLVGCSKLLGQGVAVSPVVTVEPRRRKFHKAITLSIPAPKACTKGMVNASYGNGNGNPPTLRLLCSITGGQTRAAWEDVTGSTPLAFVKDSVTFTTTVSARFWLMDCRNIADAGRMATELYTYMAQVPFVVKFVVFAKRISYTEAKFSVFCMTDDKEDKTLEQQEYFTEVAKSRDIEVLQDQTIYIEFSGNLVPVLKSGEQLNTKFQAFRENRLSFIVHIKDPELPNSRISFMTEPKVGPREAPQTPICALNVSVQDEKISTHNENGILDNVGHGNILYKEINRNALKNTDIQENTTETTAIDKNVIIEQQKNQNLNRARSNHADIRLLDICSLIGSDWPQLVKELGVPETDIDLFKAENLGDLTSEQRMLMLQLRLEEEQQGISAAKILYQALNRIGRADIIDQCMSNLESVTDKPELDLTTARKNESLPLIRTYTGPDATLMEDGNFCATPPSTPIEDETNPQSACDMRVIQEMVSEHTMQLLGEAQEYVHQRNEAITDDSFKTRDDKFDNEPIDVTEISKGLTVQSILLKKDASSIPIGGHSVIDESVNRSTGNTQDN
ncbi:ankyrin-3 isoform X4 [Drosophila obscura]|nr:ankyrin-3 isoform X4 [Drosophila obscura]XP_022217449.2 ankyrin-3 isoform X4 [Drosophila obscura]